VERTIFALFDDALAALGVAGAFEREGYERDAISLVVPDPRGRYAQPKEPAAPHVRKFQPLVVEGLGPAAATGSLAPSHRSWPSGSPSRRRATTSRACARDRR
jgi:hypothetical protein